MFTDMTTEREVSQGSWPRWRAAMLSVAIAIATAMAHAQAPPPITGDVNADGKIDILDIQGATNMALGSASAVAQADADQSAAVNVLDIQVLTNTALGVGGLIQPVSGTYVGTKGAKALSAVKVVAISTDGRMVQAELDPATGDFAADLPVRTAWSLAFINANGATVGTVAFPVAGSNVSSLPLPSLSNGPLAFGSLPGGLGAVSAVDLRTLLAERSNPLDVEDGEEYGIPKVFESLILPYPWTVVGSGIVLPGGLDIQDLQEKLSDCIEDSLEHISLPDLTGIENGGVPAFAVPMLNCFSAQLYDWIEGGETDVTPLQVSTLVGQIMAAIQPRITPWLEGLGRVELTDANHNGIPDYIEGDLCHEDEDEPAEHSGKSSGDGGGECDLDTDTNGLPDFAEDGDDDGVPNFLDPKSRTVEDSDGDAITNDKDLDDDNDGVLDYADEFPSDSTRN